MGLNLIWVVIGPGDSVGFVDTYNNAQLGKLLRRVNAKPRLFSL